MSMEQPTPSVRAKRVDPDPRSTASSAAPTPTTPNPRRPDPSNGSAWPTRADWGPTFSPARVERLPDPRAIEQPELSEPPDPSSIICDLCGKPYGRMQYDPFTGRARHMPCTNPPRLDRPDFSGDADQPTLNTRERDATVTALAIDPLPEAKPPK